MPTDRLPCESQCRPSPSDHPLSGTAASIRLRTDQRKKKIMFQINLKIAQLTRQMKDAAMPM